MQKPGGSRQLGPVMAFIFRRLVRFWHNRPRRDYSIACGFDGRKPPTRHGKGSLAFANMQSATANRGAKARTVLLGGSVEVGPCRGSLRLGQAGYTEPCLYLCTLAPWPPHRGQLSKGFHLFPVSFVRLASILVSWPPLPGVRSPRECLVVRVIPPSQLPSPL